MGKKTGFHGAISYVQLSDWMTAMGPAALHSSHPLIQRSLIMHLPARAASLAILLFAGLGVAYADNYDDAIAVFKKAGESADFFRHSVAYAVYPTVGEGGFIVGAAIGKGRVYSHHRLIGDTTMTQLSAGFQAGGKAYSQIIFFENQAALDTFRNGKFELS